MAAGIVRAEQLDCPVEAPFPEARLRMMDRIGLFVATGGPEGLGFIRSSKAVDSDEWFFKTHYLSGSGLLTTLQPYRLLVLCAESWIKMNGGVNEVFTSLC